MVTAIGIDDGHHVIGIARDARYSTMVGDDADGRADVCASATDSSAALINHLRIAEVPLVRRAPTSLRTLSRNFRCHPDDPNRVCKGATNVATAR